MDEPPSWNLLINVFHPDLSYADSGFILLSLLVIAILVFLSACFSGSENALFSLSKAQVEALVEAPGMRSKAISYLLRYPKRSLATILIGNTFVNIATVLVTSMLFASLFNFHEFPWLGFLLEVVVVTFLLVLFGEVVPKVYSFQNNERVTLMLAVPLYYLYQMLKPLVLLLEKSTSLIDKRVKKKGHILSADELTHAIDITTEKSVPGQEKRILKQVANFGNTNVKQIMRPRPEIVAVELQTGFKKLMTFIVESGYSRIPVYEDTLDQVKGILFTKDLLPYLTASDNYEWQTLLRPAYFVPESKKIDDLLKEFQQKRMHLAIVVDEFGGTSGLVSLEDIVEEIFGEIQDEFDEDEHVYTRINNSTFVFEGRMLINDMCKYLEVDPDEFEGARNEAETLAGMLLELNATLPLQGQEIRYQRFIFKIEAVDARRIKRVKVTVEPKPNTSNNP